MKKYLFFAAAIAATLASCSSEAEDAPAVDNNKQSYILSSKPFEFVDGGTRTHLTLSDNSIIFAWDYNETFGVFPVSPSVNAQAYWNIKKADARSEKGGNYAHFAGQGWQLEEGETYAAYQPYISSADDPAAIDVSLPTTQRGTLSAIDSDLDFMCATGEYEEPDPTTGHTSKVVFVFDHAISIVQIKVPYDDESSDIQIVAQEGTPFITAGTWNIATGDVTGTSFTKSITLTTPEKVENGVATFYAAIFPTTTGTCDILVHKNGVYGGNTVASKTLVKGKAYRWNLAN